MSERVSYTNRDGESVGQLSAAARWYGAAAGVFGCLLTLVLGSLFMTLSETLLTLGPGGGEVRKLFHFEHLTFLPGIWLVVPAAIAGYRLGFDRTLRVFGYFWYMAEPARHGLSTLLWFALMLTCFLSGWLVRTLG